MVTKQIDEVVEDLDTKELKILAKDNLCTLVADRYRSLLDICKCIHGSQGDMGSSSVKSAMYNYKCCERDLKKYGLWKESYDGELQTQIENTLRMYAEK